MTKMKKIILLAIALSLCPTNIFSQDTIDTTITNIAVDTLFHTIYYKDGSIAIHDSLVSGCHISWGGSGLAKFGVSQKGLAKGTISIIECATYTDGNLENIVDLEKVDRLERTSGEIISGEMAIKIIRKYQMIFTTLITVGGIIISLLLFAF